VEHVNKIIPVRVATVSIPAGTYGPLGEGSLRPGAGCVCLLGVSDTKPFDVGFADTVGPGSTLTAAVVSAQTFASATAVNLYCDGGGPVRGIKLVTIRVGTLTTSTG
jgi:hypothetical protein